MNLDGFYDFLSDSALVELIERLKVSDDMLDVIELSENQHSDMLAWCLNPNEGHAQGDAVIKDFLTAAYNATNSPRGTDNWSFFRKWTPGRIRMTSFGSVFFTREFSIGQGTSKKRGRLDLFIVDPVNEFIVIIENKVKAKLNKKQLDHYHNAIKERLCKQPTFKSFDFAFVVLDRALEWYEEEDLTKLGTNWTFLDYSWLRLAASRAGHHIARNNQAAQLLMSYCQSQTGGEELAGNRVLELAASLAGRFETVIDALRSVRFQKITSWDADTLKGVEGELMLFYHQNRQLCAKLIEVRGIAAVLVGLRSKIQGLVEKDVRKTKSWLIFLPPSVKDLVIDDEDPAWPISINIFREKEVRGASRFRVRLFWRKDEFSDRVNDSVALRRIFSRKYPELDKFHQREVRRLVIKRSLDAGEAINCALGLVGEIERLLNVAREERAVS